VELDSQEELDNHSRGPGEIKREAEPDPQESPGDAKSREVELHGLSESWTSLCFGRSPTVALRTLSLGLGFAQLLKQQLAKYTSCFSMARSPPP